MKKGTLYGVSLGPGEPDLITLRAWTLLESAGSWVYPVEQSGGNCRALTIARELGVRAPENPSELLFPTLSGTKDLAKHCLLAARHVQRMLDWGENVFFLIEGDAGKNLNYNHLVCSLKALDQDAKSELVPGVVAANAVQSNAKNHERKLTIVANSRSMQSINSTLARVDTLIIPNPKPCIGELISLLRKARLLKKSMVIENVGTPEERTITDLEKLKGNILGKLSLLYVDNSQRVGNTVSPDFSAV